MCGMWKEFISDHIRDFFNWCNGLTLVINNLKYSLHLYSTMYLWVYCLPASATPKQPLGICVKASMKNIPCAH